MTFHNQRGGAALLTVTFTAFVIVAITVSMTRLMAGELRQAIDAENTTLAYYQAESGADVATQALRLKLMSGAPLSTFNQGCVTGPDLVTAYGLPDLISSNLSCRAIAVKSSVFDEPVGNRIAKQFFYPTPSFSYMKITWDSEEVPDPRGFTPDLSNPGRDGEPPYIEVINTRLGSSPQGCLLRPTPTGTAPTAVMLSSCGGNAANVACTLGGDGRRCQANVYLGTLSASGGVIHVRPLFTTVARIRVEFIGSSWLGPPTPTPIFMPDARIDVTAKAGDSYRRVIKSVPIISLPQLSGDVISGDDGVCKSFDVLSANGLEEVQNFDDCIP